LNGIRQSQITPTVTYNSTDSPLFPTRGKNITYGASFAGGPLGGNVNTISNIFDMSYFHPVYHHRNVLALHFKTSMISGYGGKEVPPNNRFYAGGENDVRGFDFYTISPFVFIPFSTTTSVTYVDPRRLNAQGQPTLVSLPVNVLEFIPTRPGGDLEAVSNIEYRIPLVKSYVTMSFFHDVAVNGILRRSQLQLDPSAIASLQQQYPNADFPCLPNTPCLRVPRNLQIAHGTNFWPHTSAGIEFEFQIPIIQAPFRIFYAYNYSRFRQSIEPPLGAFFVPPAERNSLQQLGVYNTQIVPDLQSFLNLTRSSQTVPPSLFEQKTTLRFAVSRTF
jgi:outer membrane protein insertion porin family